LQIVFFTQVKQTGLLTNNDILKIHACIEENRAGYSECLMLCEYFLFCDDKQAPPLQQPAYLNDIFSHINPVEIPLV